MELDHMKLHTIRIIKKIFIRVKKNIYKNKFKSFNISSSIGSDGCGKDAIVEGADNISIGTNTVIGSGSEIIAINKHFNQVLTPDLKIGNHVRVTSKCRITCAGCISIEDDVLMGPEVFITDHGHGMNPVSKNGYSPQQLIVKNVTIKKGAWIGQRVCILPGTTVGMHSIIGAGSIVTKSIPDYCMAVGNPAKIIKRWDFNLKEWVRCSE